jgi:hypothetical protein
VPRDHDLPHWLLVVMLSACTEGHIFALGARTYAVHRPWEVRGAGL